MAIKVAAAILLLAVFASQAEAANFLYLVRQASAFAGPQVSLTNARDNDTTGRTTFTRAVTAG